MNAAFALSLYSAAPRPYVSPSCKEQRELPMRAEAVSLIEEIKQSVGLLRRHL
jgi:hypothetical protein